jgi:hypothetical protein
MSSGSYADRLCIQFEFVEKEVTAGRTKTLCDWLEGLYEDVKDKPSMKEVGENMYGSCFRDVYMSVVGKSLKDFYQKPEKVRRAVGIEDSDANEYNPAEIMRQYYLYPTHDMGSITHHAVFNWKPENNDSALFKELANVVARFEKVPPNYEYSSASDKKNEDEFKHYWVYPEVEVVSKKSKSVCGSPAKKSKR